MAGDEGADDPVMLPNPYLAAIRAARQQATGPAQQLADGLKAVDGAMQANCWQSTVADQFYAELAEQRTTLSRCQTRALEEFDHAISGQPEKVPAGAWQFHWHNI
jgi:hypothetical protein